MSESPRRRLAVRLRVLEQAATSAPWETTRHVGLIVHQDRGGGLTVVDSPLSFADRELVVALRNALPQILDILADTLDGP